MADVKICGVTTDAARQAAEDAGAAWFGLVFYPPSPRAITHAAAAPLARAAGPGCQPVGLVVDPTDQELDVLLAAVPLAVLQLHGSETPERAAAIRQHFGVAVMKALRVRCRDDLAAIEAYAPLVDRLLLDSAGGAGLPGGTGEAFDWSLLAGRHMPRFWLLAGGLTPATVGAAIAATGAPAVDVSSGVESQRGVKDPALIQRFCQAAGAGAGTAMDHG